MTLITYQKTIKFLGLLFWVGLSLLPAAIGSVAISNNPELFDALNKPSGTPSANTLPTIWVVVDIFTGIGVWLAWCKKQSYYRYYGITLFGLQLFLNGIIYWLLLYWQNGALSFIDALCLLLCSITIASLFWYVDKLATLCIVPLILWSAYISYFNYELWQMNPEILGDQKTEVHIN